ncbi:MAG: Uma2 family endonuclease [Cyanobacteria bacterium J06607_13]
MLTTPTSLLDDLGIKRSLYEDLSVSEYWIIDVKKETVIFFQMQQKGSQRIDTSKALPGLDTLTLQEAMKISRTSDQAQMGAWLLQKFQQSKES